MSVVCEILSHQLKGGTNCLFNTVVAFSRLSYPKRLTILELMGESYIQNAKTVFASEVPTFAKKLEVVASFLIENQDLSPRLSRGINFGTNEYWEKLAQRFANARSPRAPQQPSTIPDPMVSVILHEYFDFQESELGTVAKQHSLAMAAESIVGDLLERYIADKMEDFGWVWCSGEVVKKVDFLAAGTEEPSSWIPVQIKNRDNSENSSSASVREGTAIIKWFRTFSRTGKTNWEAFPESVEPSELSEIEFQRFAKTYLSSLRTQNSAV